MICFRKHLFYLYLIINLLCISGMAWCDDWPMWRNNAGRTAASSENLSDELNLLWIRHYTPRTMVWDDPLNHDLMPYDRIFEPVVMGKTMFIGFNDSDRIVALDTETGEEKWTFYTDGPVRLPPVAWNGKIYVTSDDGYLYCLDEREGKIIWKFRGGPTDRKILGNKRLISIWPARGGPVITDGKVYWAASIWPFMGIFIYALDAETGDVVWINDKNGSRYMLQPHTAPSFAGVAPQGSFVVSGDRLLVPGGRSVPACFDRTTGTFTYYLLAEYSQTGGSFVSAQEDVFFNHHREGITSMYDLENGALLVPHIGRYPVLTDKVFYFSGKTVTAYNAGWIHASLETWKHSLLETKDISKRTAKKMQESLLWEIPVDASGDLIKAGSRLYAAGNRQITAIDLSGDSKPAVAWVKMVDDKVERLLVADGKLFTVTLDGRIMAFGAKKTTPNEIHTPPPVVEPSAETTQKAMALLEQTGIREGYALFYGIGDGNFLEALLSNSQLHIVAFDPDADKVQSMRQNFDASGYYGGRISVLQGNPLTLDIPPYIASLTIINNLDFRKYRPDRLFLERIFNSMRPYGGVAWLPLKGNDRENFSMLARGSGLEGLKVIEFDAAVVLIRKGRLPGAGEWTHNTGNIANTGKSDDILVKLPLGILWFGGNSNLDVLPRHGHGPTEQVIGGRLFIEGMDCLSTRDVYTGRVLWKVMLHDLGNYGVYFDHTYKNAPTEIHGNQAHIPGANIRGTNYVATEDRVYVIQGNSCHVLDSATGQTLAIVTLPPIDPSAEKPQSPQWGYIGVYEDMLLAGYGFVHFSDLLQQKKAEYSPKEDYDKSASKGLIVMNRFTGEILWRIDSNHGFLHNGIAAGNNMIFCLDKLPPHIEKQLQRRGKTFPDTYRLLAMDSATGEIIWEKRDAVFGTYLTYSLEHDIVLQSTRPSRDTVVGEDGKRMIAFRGKDGALIWDKNIMYETFPLLHGDKIITDIYENIEVLVLDSKTRTSRTRQSGMFSLLTGEPLDRRDPLTGGRIPWSWKRHHGCNYPIASENLITFRSGAAGFYDLTGAGGTGNFGGFKSGCSINLVAADGVLNAPDYTRTCICSYQNQTSLALVHMPDVEIWSFNTITWDGAPIKQVGINFGAPGNHTASNGMLWLDYPSIGGDSLDIGISTIPEQPEWYRYHSSRFTDGRFSWVSASGGEGLESVTLTLAKDPMKDMHYTVRLYFAEPENIREGERVFDISIQGTCLLKNFDILKETGQSRKVIIKEFNNVTIERDLIVSFNTVTERGEKPVISGIEIVNENM